MEGILIPYFLVRTTKPKQVIRMIEAVTRTSGEQVYFIVEAPGYIVIEADTYLIAHSVIRKIRGASLVAGTIPYSEVEGYLYVKEAEVRITFVKGDTVEVTKGAMKGLRGKVEAVENNIAIVTPIDEFTQLRLRLRLDVLKKVRR